MSTSSSNPEADEERSVLAPERRALVRRAPEAGRVQPGAEYAKFVQFTQQADQLIAREIAIGR